MTKKGKKNKQKLAKPLKFTLIGGHMAHLIAQLSNLKYFKSQKKIYYKLLTTSDSKKYKSLMHQRKRLPEKASTMSWELHRSDPKSSDFTIRVVYNNEPIDFCSLGNESSNYICPLEKFKQSVMKLSNHKFKTQCGMHLKYKMPELRHADHSTLIPNIILGILVLLTILFSVVGWLIRKRYKYLDAMINKELGDMDKRLE